MEKQVFYEQAVEKVIREWNPIEFSQPQNEYFDVISDVFDSTTYKSAPLTIARAVRKSFLVTYGKQISIDECRKWAEKIKILIT